MKDGVLMKLNELTLEILKQHGLDLSPNSPALFISFTRLLLLEMTGFEDVHAAYKIIAKKQMSAIPEIKEKFLSGLSNLKICNEDAEQLWVFVSR